MTPDLQSLRVCEETLLGGNKASTAPIVKADPHRRRHSPAPVDSDFPICQHPAMRNLIVSLEIRPAILRG